MEPSIRSGQEKEETIMLRTIKFRGKPINKVGNIWDAKWFVGLLQPAVYNRYAICFDYIKSWDDFLLYEVIPDTVGQFTGMYDKNGKEIYEGDILLSKDEYGTVEVIFAHGAFQVRYFCKNGEHRIPFTNLKKDYELLGNIHDNPGLLDAVGYKFKENKEGGEE